MKVKLIIITFSVAVFATACSALLKVNAPLSTVPSVELDRYVGQWYAIAALPQFFTRKCVAQDAVYGLNSSTEISVKNTCTKKNGKTTDISGFAKTTDTAGVLELKFTSGIAGFFGASGDYNIIKLDPEYRYSLIGGNDRDSLWLLSRTTEVSDIIYDEYVNRAGELGYDISKLIKSER